MKQPAHELVEHFFRHESANLVAVLTRVFGIRYMDLVEDVVQVALMEALQNWRQRGLPENPAGWIHRAAKNRILDALRSEKIHEQARIVSELRPQTAENLIEERLETERISDSLLRMMFICCHPSLDRNTQIAFTLKTLCGFGISEVASGLFLPEETVKKRIQRAKRSLAAIQVKLELPGDEQLRQRLEVVHDVIYLLFNEGYSASSGRDPIRDDICEEAVRLCHILCKSRYSIPSTRALLALLLFHSARLNSRTNDVGAIILLEAQDRSRWDQNLIRMGQEWLLRSREERPTIFHLEAAIAMHHCVSPSMEATDWQAIVQLYGQLLKHRDSPVYVLNQAIALAQGGKTDAAFRALPSLRNRKEIRNYLLLDCAIARVYELDGDLRNAAASYVLALDKQPAEHEKLLIKEKLDRLSDLL